MSFAQLLLMVLMGGGGLPFPAGVPPLEEDPALVAVAPAETVFFAEWFGTGTPSAESENGTERLAANEEVRRLVVTAAEALRAVVRAEAPRDGRVVIEEGLRMLELLVTRPGCVFVSGVDLPPQPPAVYGGIVVNIGGQASEAGRAMREIETTLLREMTGGREGPQPATIAVGGTTFRSFPLPPQMPPVAWGFSGEYLILAVGNDMPRRIVEGLRGGSGLGAEQTFTGLHAQVRVERPSFRSYVNVAEVVEKAAAVGGPKVLAVLSALGLNGVTAVVTESGLEGTGFLSKSLVATRGVPAGLLRLAEGEPLSDSEIAIIPGDATVAAAFRLSPETMYREFLTVLGGIDPRAREEFLREVPRQFEQELGLRLQEDILEPLGDAWCLWNSPGQGGLLVTGLTAAVSVKNRDRLERTMDRIIALLNEEMGPPRRSGERRRPRGVFIDSFRHKGTKIYYLNAVGEELPVAPAWCLTETHLMVSVFPQMLKATLDRGANEADSIAGHPALADRGSVLSFSMMDTAEVFRTLYPILHPLAQLACAQLQREGIDITIASLPSAAGIAPHLTGEVSTARRTEAGVLFTARGTVPNLGPVVGIAVPFVVGAAVMIPTVAVPQARARAEEVQGMAELRQIGMAIQLYTLDKGSAPDSLEALWSGENKYLEQPARDPWGNPFLYWKGAEPAEPGEMIAATSRPQRGMRLVLFGDAHVELVPEPRFQELLRERVQEQDKVAR